jgi:hypothetical protein
MDRDIVAAYKEYYGRAPDQAGHDAFVNSKLQGDKLMQAILRASTADPAGADYKYAVAKGYNPNDPIAKFLKSSKAASNPVLESFAVGTNFVPYDMVARIHEGEEIKPRAFVDLDRDDREETNELLRRLTAIYEKQGVELTLVKLELTAIKLSNDKLAKILDRVTRGGDSMVTST